MKIQDECGDGYHSACPGECECHCHKPSDNPKRLAAVKRLTESGWLDPNCKMCQDLFINTDRMPLDVFAPRHNASHGCRSGMHPHCTCDTCF